MSMGKNTDAHDTDCFLNRWSDVRVVSGAPERKPDRAASCARRAPCATRSDRPRSSKAKRPPAPKREAIAAAQASLVASLGIPLDKAAVTCWACKYEAHEPEHYPERAHIVGIANGGNSEPDNYFLLCTRCHYTQPDGAPLVAQIAWLESHLTWGDELYWDWVPVKNVLRRMAKDVTGDSDVADRWLFWLSLEERGAILDRGSDAACGWQWTNARASEVWTFVAAFDEWLKTGAWRKAA